ncbi:MAG: flagellar filament capping protein FliD [Gemmatimonadaceae bacterium]|nr:flagellar filament capping protein FliD [Gemmatimonadaceae bacterium]
MTTPIGSFQGLASGIQWRDLVDQIITLETARALNPITTAISQENDRIGAWQTLSAAVTKARDALAALKDGSAFRQRTASAAASPTSGRALVTVSGVANASPGRYAVEVENLAQGERLTGLAVADAGEALGLDGRFSINGVAVTLDSGDSLARVRDKINAANSGAAPSRVTATISTVAGVSRLILSADVTGARGIELADDRSGTGSTSTLEALGLVDTTRAMNTGSDGKVRSTRVSSSTLAAAAALGISVSPSPATILVNGRTLTVDLENDSLTDIVARINALSPGAATVETETDGSTTWSRIAVSGAVSGDGSPEANVLLEALGMRVGGRTSNVTQAVSVDTVLTGFGGATATGSTLLVDLGAGSAAGIQAGDVLTLTGTDGAGTAVSLSYTVTGTDTVDDLLGAIEGAFSGGRAVDASIVDGRLRFTDAVSGESRLAVSLSAGLQAGGTLDLSATSTTYGRVRQLAAGEDARIRVDGTVLTSATNTITGAVGGATLALTGEEDGTTIDVTIAANPESAVAAAAAFTTAYNELLAAVEAETKSGGRIQFSSSARAVLGAMKGVLLSDVAGLGSGTTYNRAGLVGLSLQRDGKLALDQAKLRGVLASDPGAVESLFASAGSSDSGSVQYVGADAVTPAGSWALAVTQAATRSTTLGGILASYVAGATPASMTITSESTGRSATIDFVHGDTPAIIAARLQAALDEEAVGVSATVEGGALRLTSSEYGTRAGFTVSYSDPGSEAPATQLGIAAGSYDTGLDAVATLDGVAMTGDGQLLTAANGLVLRYTGTANALTTTARYAQGVAGALTIAANSVLAAGSGTAALQILSAQDRLATLERRSTDITDRLERRRQTLVADFTRMETALAKLQAQGSWLTQQVTAMNASASSN